MEQEIIKKYESNYSIESLAKEYKVGKLKIKKILEDNNIILKNRGGQTKYILIEQSKDIDYVLSCKCCNKDFLDFENKSGSITNHIKQCFPNEIIPSSFKRRMFLKSTGNHWHLSFFNLKPKTIISTVKCSECGWETKDLTNKTGSLTKHIESNHKSINDYLLKYPQETYLFSSIKKSIDREKLFEDSSNFITCEICGEQFKTITNTHLLLHNTNTKDYQIKFGNNILLCINTKNKFIKNLSNCEISYSYRSKSEIEIEEFIKSLGVEVKICDKKQLSGTELDIFLPEYSIAIEYNGLYWHSENRGKHKNYHIEKTLKCLSKNIQLIHIFSDEWLYKKNIIKNRIINLLKKNDTKIYARNCKIVTLNNLDKKKYLIDNHLQGNDKSFINYALVFNDKIVGIMTFGKYRKVLGSNKKNNEYELYRYCSNNVVGGFSKLLKHFIKNNNPKKIITYSNRNWSPSNDFCFYSKFGFSYIGATKPNYSYTKKYDIREHRFNYRKDILVKLGYDKNKTEEQIMFELGYDRIWDTGNLKYEIVL